jgi:hypothetical protein
LRRFLLHVLPPGFVRIRHFGFLAHRRRAALLPLCFQFLGRPSNLPPTPGLPPDDEEGSSITLPAIFSWPCPQCGGPMIILERLTAAEMCLRSPPPPSRGSHEIQPSDSTTRHRLPTPALSCACLHARHPSLLTRSLHTPSKAARVGG